MKTTIITGGRGSGKNLKASELIAGRKCINLDAEHLDNKQSFAELTEGINVIVVDDVTNQTWLIQRLQALIIEGVIHYRNSFTKVPKEHAIEELFILSHEKLNLKLNDGDALIQL